LGEDERKRRRNLARRGRGKEEKAIRPLQGKKEREKKEVKKVKANKKCLLSGWEFWLGCRNRRIRRRAFSTNPFLLQASTTRFFSGIIKGK
jgi:hypothetical protein